MRKRLVLDVGGQREVPRRRERVEAAEQHQTLHVCAQPDQEQHERLLGVYAALVAPVGEVAVDR